MSRMKWERSKRVKGVCKSKITFSYRRNAADLRGAEIICRVWWGAVNSGKIKELEILVEPLVESGNKRKNTDKTICNRKKECVEVRLERSCRVWRCPDLDHDMRVSRLGGIRGQDHRTKGQGMLVILSSLVTCTPSFWFLRLWYLIYSLRT